MAPFPPLSQTVSQDRISIKKDPHSGKGVFAAKQISLNTPVLSVTRPLIVALDTLRLKDTCYHCHDWRERSFREEKNSTREEVPLKACTGCKVVRYCNKYCQEESWKTYHRYECKIFANIHPKVLPNNVRGILRLLLVHKANRLVEGEWNQLIALKGHVGKFRKASGERWQNLCLMAKAAKEYSGTDLEEEQIVGLFARLMINSFSLTNENYDPLGLALHPLPAQINHCCSYNSVVKFQRPNQIVVVPMETLSAGTEILISYIDATQPTTHRQRELQERYFFKCECDRCDPTIGTLSPNTWLLDPEAAQIDAEAVEARALSLLEASIKDTSASGSANKAKYGLHLLAATKVWPIFRYPVPALRHELILSYLKGQQFNLAFAHASIRYFRIDPKLFLEEHDPQRMIHDWVFVNLMEHILGLDGWAGQKLDLLPYKIGIRYWRDYILRNLDRTCKKTVHTSLSYKVQDMHAVARWGPGRWGYAASAQHDRVLDDKKVYAEQLELVNKLMDDVLEEEKVWNTLT